ncbi:MAG: cysteine--tRNA ligase [Hyphomicrobiaceae bacterium]
MEIQLYDTLTRKKRTFTPLDANNVRMYVCGPTVYDYAHIGNARPVIVFDVVFRLLREVFGSDHVTYARNITDVDDKINKRAFDEGVPIADITARTTKQFHDDIGQLGVLPPTVEPRATDHIKEMVAMCETLVEKGHAYVAEGHVLFSVSSMPDYGQLSNRSLDEMEAGARIEVAPYKKDPMDFVLWKPSKDGEPGWPSPAGIEGKGRPGWHIECSAMSARHLGEVIDIHGGGVDLAFPHHENEVAQSRCAHGTKQMAQVWMHNGFLQVEGEKMSKSLGNFITINDLLKTWQGEVVRLAMLLTHYRQPINWTKAGLQEAKRTLDAWYAVAGEVPRGEGVIHQGVLAALAEDINTPQAMAVLHDLRNKASRGDEAARADLAASLRFLGLLQIDANEWVSWRPPALDLDEELIVRQIAARAAARNAKNWAESDRIRDELTAMGIALKDTKDPETGEISTTWAIAH